MNRSPRAPKPIGSRADAPAPSIRRGRRLIVLVAVLLAALGAAGAWAYFSAPASAGSAGGAQAATVGAGATPSVQLIGGRTIELEWGASSVSNGRPVDGYLVTRYDASTSAHVAVPTFSGCNGVLTARSCTDGAVPAGEWTYTVTPVVGDHWRGAQSAESGAVTIAPAKVSLDKTLFAAVDYGGGSASESGSVSGFAAGEALGFRVDDPDSGQAAPGSPASVDNAGSADYTAHVPSLVDGGHTFWAVGGASPRSQASAPFVVDATPPDASLAGVDGDWHDSDVEASIAATDPAPGTGVSSIGYSVDGGATTTVAGATAAVDFPASSDHSDDGDHLLRYVATDVAGNSSFLQQAHVKIDTTAPQTTITTMPSVPDGSNGWFQQSSVSFTLDATDPNAPASGSGVAGTFYAVDGGAPHAYFGSVAITDPGEHTVTYWSTDVAGNTEDTQTAHVDLDDVAPSTSAATDPETPDGADNWFTVPSVTLTLSASDDTSGVASTSYSVDGGSAQTYSGPVAITDDGDHTIKYWSVDTAGNTEAQSSIRIKLDHTAPVTTATTTPAAPDGTNDWFKQTSVAVQLDATDPASGVDGTFYTIDGGLQHSYSGPFTLTDPGTHTIAFWSIDHALNVENDQNLTVKLDAVPPATALAVTPALADGSNGWYVTAPSFSLSASDATSGVATTFYTLDGGSATSYGGGRIALADGQHTITYWSVDNAGNVESTHTSATIEVDTVKPTTTLTLSPASPDGSNGWNVNPTTFTLAATDATSGIASTKYQLDAGAPQTYTGAAVSIPEGQHTVTYWSVDNAGNVEGQQTTGTIKIDTVKPATTIQITPTTANGSNGWYVTTPTFVLTPSDATSGVSGTFYSIDGGSQQAYGGGSVSIPDGQHTVTYWSVDTAGNTETGHTTATIKVDTTKPSNALALALGAVGAFLNGNTLYFNGAASGSFAWVDSVTDTGSGAASATFPGISGTFGWTTKGQSTVSSPAGGPFSSSSYSFGPQFGFPANTPSSNSITSKDTAGNTSTSFTVTYVRDTTAPTGGALTVNGTVASGSGSTSTAATTSFAIGSRTDYAETTSSSASGLASSILTVQSATLSSNSCGSTGSGGPFTTATAIDGTTQPSGIQGGFCYVYTLTGTDHVANSASVKTTVKVPLAPTVTSVTPSSLVQGTSNQTVVLAGSNFQSSPTVSFSGTGITVNSVTFNSSSQLTLKVTIAGNAATGARDITVTNTDSGSGSCSGCFTVNAVPTISAPTSGARQNLTRGQTGNVNITGTGFQTGAQVAISGNGITINSVTVNSATSITASVSVASNANNFGANANRDLTVTNPDGGNVTSSSAIHIS